MLFSCIASFASACPGVGFQNYVMFNQVPFGLDAAIIARVTVVDTHSDIGHRKFVSGRVDQILKGALKGDYISFSYVQSSCGPFRARIGDTGIVLGKITRVDNGVSELAVIEDSFMRMQQRKKEKGVE